MNKTALAPGVLKTSSHNFTILIAFSFFYVYHKNIEFIMG